MQIRALCSLILQVSALALVIIFAAIWRKKKNWILIISPIFMFLINFVAQGIIAGGGPGLAIGSVLLPLYAFFFVSITVNIANRISEKKVCPKWSAECKDRPLKGRKTPQRG